MAKSFLIGLPARNGGDHLRQCVASILAQTYREFELLVLDNASSDGSLQWLRSQVDSRIRVVESGEPLSIEASWARLVRTAGSHEYMTMTGHDDLFEPNFLETVSRLIDANPTASLYQTHFQLIDARGARIRSCIAMPACERAHEFLDARLSFARDSFGTGYVFRSADYVRVGGIPLYDKLLFADDALWMMLMQGSFKVTDARQCFSYRVHSASTSYAPDWRSLYRSLELYLALLGQQAACDDAIRAVLECRLPRYVGYVVRLGYFSRNSSPQDRAELSRAISRLLPLVQPLLSPRAARRFEQRLRDEVFGVLARPRWLAWRAQTWIRRRLAAVMG